MNSPVEVQSFFLCDDVRVENTNKLLLVGVYASTLNFGSCPGIAMVRPIVALRSSKVGSFSVSLRLSWIGWEATSAGSDVPPTLAQEIVFDTAGATIQLSLPPLVLQVPKSCPLILSYSADIKGNDWTEIARVNLFVPEQFQMDQPILPEFSS
jgi:hypothetical protein